MSLLRRGLMSWSLFAFLVGRVSLRAHVGNRLGARFLSSTIHMFSEMSKLHSVLGSVANGLATAATERFSRLRFAIDFEGESQKDFDR